MKGVGSISPMHSLYILLVVVFVVNAQIQTRKVDSRESATDSSAGQHQQQPPLQRRRSLNSRSNCNDIKWCNLKAPQKSYFGFQGPISATKWEEAKVKAMNGDQVLLTKVMQQFPHYLDFLDGDTRFRKINHFADFFIDRNHDLSPLMNDHLVPKVKSGAHQPYKWGNSHVLERNHDYYTTQRAPIFKVGYFAFSSLNSPLYGGAELGKAVVSREQLLDYWRQVKDMVKRPFIALDVHEENWGLLSTQFPNRTRNWGLCCSPVDTKAFYEFLDHNKTLMVLINQHHNFSHPKLITLPRGLPLQTEHSERIIWDTMQSVLLKQMRKSELAYTSVSSASFRSRILQCIQNNFPGGEFKAINTSVEDQGVKLQRVGTLAYRKEYYTNLAAARVGIALPGIGYDTYRLWEILTMGSMAVIERGVGLDRTVWRLPVLLVDDFSQLTPELLRTAYVEAIYRTESGQFEFQRLRQSYWWSFIMRISKSKSVADILSTFPMDAEDTEFTRPVEQFSCGVKSGDMTACGKGTKRIPINPC